MTLTTWQFTSWYYVNAQHLSFSTTLHFVAQPLSSFSILGCHHLNEGAINYKRAIVVDCDCFHLLLSYMLSHHPSCSLTLCPSLLRSILLYLAPPHLISYSKQKENTERSPIDFSSSCISNCVFTNKLGEVAEDIWPGARPVLSFPLSFPHPPPFPAPTVLDSPYSPTCSLSTMIYVMNSRTLDLTLPPRYCYC